MSIDDYKAAQDPLFQEKLRKIEGLSPKEAYPYRFERTNDVASIRREYSGLEAGTVTDSPQVITGRVMGKRIMGKALFIDLQEGNEQIQLFVSQKHAPVQYDLLKTSDIGDIFGVNGRVMTTKTRELSLYVDDAVRLAKTLRGFPNKVQGLTDVESRSKQRYLDLICNSESAKVLKARSEIFESIRRQLRSKNFLEVETPILQPVYGGANARPFTTKHNALDQQMFLRISNELYLKRLIIGGFDKVFEFAKDFRNESIDTTHNPEFTQLEIYQSYADYSDMMELVENLVSNTSSEVFGKTELPYQGNVLNFAKPWTKISMHDAVKKYAGIDFKVATDEQVARAVSLTGEKGEFTRGEAMNLLFEHHAESKLFQPTIVYDYPMEISPLAKRHRSEEGLVERFEVFVAGKELGNAYSELNDPLDQRERFMHQQNKKDKGDEEAHPIDEEFLEAMEYGMPPTGGLGIGMDRLTAFLTDRRSIRDVLLFPMLRREKKIEKG